MHFFENSPLLGDTGRYVPRFVVYIVLRVQPKNAQPTMKKILIIAVVGVALMSCNVTRTVTTRSEAWQKGDTSVVIQTKTIESYDGVKH